MADTNIAHLRRLSRATRAKLPPRSHAALCPSGRRSRWPGALLLAAQMLLTLLVTVAGAALLVAALFARLR